MSDSLLLKWGTLKGWDLEGEAAMRALEKYASIGEHASGAAQQCDTPEQVEALCGLIDAIDGEIRNDWTGEAMTKDEAKAYVRDYRR